MILTNLQGVADLVVRQAQRHGYIVPRQVRTLLSEAGVPESLWKDVLAVARPALAYRNGRYYYTAPVSERVRQQQVQQHDIQNAVRRIIQVIRRQRGTTKVERREEDRIDFVQPVQLKTEDGREHTLLSRDLSASGIRLIGIRSFLGQKVRVRIPAADGSAAWEFVVRILWTCAVGSDLVENGGTFLEMVDAE